uniref:Uncharacterized protein n=1 Tax=Acrobeloides nanus TaxID=290746 RepID=A0A914E533_9BILA
MLPGVKGSLNSFLDLPEILLPHAISGSLSGYTFAIKDIFDITGYKTVAGNPDIYQESEVKSKNAHVVQKLLVSARYNQSDISALKEVMKADIRALKEVMKTDNAALKEVMKIENASLKDSINCTRYVLGATGIAVVLIFFIKDEQ